MKNSNLVIKEERKTRSSLFLSIKISNVEADQIIWLKTSRNDVQNFRYNLANLLYMSEQWAYTCIIYFALFILFLVFSNYLFKLVRDDSHEMLVWLFTKPRCGYTT